MAGGTNFPLLLVGRTLPLHALGFETKGFDPARILTLGLWGSFCRIALGQFSPWIVAFRLNRLRLFLPHFALLS